MNNKIWLVFISLLFFGCKKNPFDYRTNYLGKYDFTIHYTSYSPISGHFDTTYSTSGIIENDSEENSILISSPIFSLHAIIYEDGTLEGYYNNNGRGDFISKKEMQYIWAGYSSGSNSTFKMKGNKN